MSYVWEGMLISYFGWDWHSFFPFFFLEVGIGFLLKKIKQLYGFKGDDHPASLKGTAHWWQPVPPWGSDSFWPCCTRAFAAFSIPSVTFQTTPMNSGNLWHVIGGGQSAYAHVGIVKWHRIRPAAFPPLNHCGSSSFDLATAVHQQSWDDPVTVNP